MQVTSKAIFTLAVLCLATASGASAQQPPPANPPDSQPTPSELRAAEEARPPVSIEPSAQLFATMCALDAAGLDPNGGGSPGRLRLRAQMENLHGPAVNALRKFYQDHELGDPGATLSRYVVYALEMGPPPDFEIQVHHEDISPDALALEGFGDVLADFYAEAHIGDIWQQVEPQYDAAASSVAGPVSNVVYITSGYLREVINPASPQKFTVYIEPLVGAHSNFLNLGDHYAFVVDPGRDLPVVEIRHAFLHFFLDPLAYRFHNTIAVDAPLLGYAARAPRLPSGYSDDLTSYFTECLVRAVELRIDRPADLAARLDSEDADGYVLVRPLVTQLMQFEKATPPMNLYYPDLVHGIDVAAESRRLDSVKFAPRDETADVSQPHIDVVYADKADLEEGERDIALNNGAGAAAAFGRVLSRRPSEARALFGMAVASLMQGQGQQAQQLFARIIAAGATPTAPAGVPSASAPAAGSAPPPDPDRPDARMLCWSHVYLGRLYDVQGNRDQAVAEYTAALGVTGAPDDARAAAQNGMSQSFQAPKRADSPGNAHQ